MDPDEEEARINPTPESSAIQFEDDSAAIASEPPRPNTESHCEAELHSEINEADSPGKQEPSSIAGGEGEEVTKGVAESEEAPLVEAQDASLIGGGELEASPAISGDDDEVADGGDGNSGQGRLVATSYVAAAGVIEETEDAGVVGEGETTEVADALEHEPSMEVTGTTGESAQGVGKISIDKVISMDQEAVENAEPAEVHEETERDGLPEDQTTGLGEETGIQEGKERDVVAVQTEIPQVNEEANLLEPEEDESAEEAGLPNESYIDDDVEPIGFLVHAGVAQVKEAGVNDLVDGKETEMTMVPDSADQTAVWQETTVAEEASETSLPEETKPVAVESMPLVDEKREISENDNVSQFSEMADMDNEAVVSNMANASEFLFDKEVVSAVEPSGALGEIHIERTSETEMSTDADNGENTHNLENVEMTENAEVADAMEDTDKEEETESEAGMGTAEDTEVADTVEGRDAEAAEETEELEEVDELSKMNGSKRKRGKNSKVLVRARSRKKVEEDVCFICFDGGDLVLCDRRGCPKVYHTSCVGRDDAFFQSKGRWNCGWHLCTNCKKNAYYMCYTCTFSLCKGCIKNAVIFCIRGNKGLCESCMNVVTFIEGNEHGKKEKAQIDFDDKSSWEYLFKDYWTGLKERLSLTPEELALAKNPWKGADPQAAKREANQLSDADDASDSGNSSGKSEATIPKRRKTRSQSKSRAKEGLSFVVGAKGGNADENAEWASKELLEIVMHMRDGDKSVLSRMELSQLILDYIRKHKLRDHRNKSYVICDARLKNLFGKSRVGHIEMLNLLDPHIFFTKEDTQPDDLQESVVDAEANQAEADWNADANTKAKDKKRKSRRKGSSRGLQSNIDDYAAIDMHNINLIYLRRTLVEDLLEDTESFHDKVVGSFVRIRISGAGQKQDLYRLVQVVGTSKVAEPYKVGKRTTDFLLEILNLSKAEVISIDIISNQEFTEDECKRLRQSIKCGLIKRLTVGDIQDKALAVHEVRVKDWLETETVRLSHLRDRASETGRRKDLRECVEKLQLLKTPEECQRRLEEVPEIHDDPNMDPSYVSDDEEEADDRRKDTFLWPRGSGFSRRDREPISPRKGGLSSGDSWSGSRSYPSIGREPSRNLSSKGLSNRGDESAGSGEVLGEKYWRDRETQQINSWDNKPKTTSNFETSTNNNLNLVKQEPASKISSEVAPMPLSTGPTATGQINETEKMWHYRDPSGKIQGPFSMVQLRKWNNTGYFPDDLKIWRTTKKQEDYILLADALAGKFQKDPPLVENSFSKIQMALLSGNPSVQPSQQGLEEKARERLKFDHNLAALNPDRSLGSLGQSSTPSSLKVSNYSRDEWTSGTNLPSPTPNQTSAGGTRGRPFRSKWSPTPAQSSASVSVSNPFLGNAGGLQPSPENGHPISPTPKSQSGVLFSSTNNPQMHSQSMLSNESQRVQLNVQASSVSDTKNTGTSNSAALQKPPVENHCWGPGSNSRLETGAMATGTRWSNSSSQRPEANPTAMAVQPALYGQWQPGPFPNAGQLGVPVSDPYRAPIPSQSNTQLPVPTNLAWGVGSTENTSAAPRTMPVNQNLAWAPMRQGTPSMGWGAAVPMMWGTSNQAQMPGNPNQSWPPNQGQVPGSTNQNWMAPQNAVQGWAPPSQGPGVVNAMVQPWMASGQGAVAGNTNSGWTGTAGNMGTWGNENNQNGDSIAGQRERGSHGGDPGYGGNQSWNRQPSFGNGGGSSRLPFKGQRVCKYHENGHCKKGAQCDYLHT